VPDSEKRQWVLDMAKELGVPLSALELDAVLEAAVLELKQLNGELVK
jgi:hypothetical protein